MAKIIINADDFGMNHSANMAIEKALKEDVITSTTIMANTETPDVVVRVFDELKNTKSFGAHLNLTEGRCLTESAAFHRIGLVDENNCFSLSPRNIEWTQELLQDVYKEWQAQIKTIKTMGISISHIDGHHHSHNIPGLQPVLFQICHNEGINKIRHTFYLPIRWRIRTYIKHDNVTHQTPSGSGLSTECKVQTKKTNPIISHLNALYSEQIWKKRVKNEGIRITDFFGSYKTFYGYLKNGYKLQRNNIVELMCHPGAEATTEETSLIHGRAIEQFLNDVEYLNYNQL